MMALWEDCQEFLNDKIQIGHQKPENMSKSGCSKCFQSFQSKKMSLLL